MVGGYLRVKSKRQFRVTLRPEPITLSAVMRHLLPMRYEVWRSNKNKDTCICSAEGSEAFDTLPPLFGTWHLGPWSGGAEGDINRLRLIRVVDHQRSDRLTAAPPICGNGNSTWVKSAAANWSALEVMLPLADW